MNCGLLADPFCACRDRALTGQHTDRIRRFKLQPAEIAALCLSVVVMVLLHFVGTVLRAARQEQLDELNHSQVACLQVAALANACGVGGGAFFVPMFNVLLGFSKFTRPAVLMLLLTLTELRLHMVLCQFELSLLICRSQRVNCPFSGGSHWRCVSRLRVQQLQAPP